MIRLRNALAIALVLQPLAGQNIFHGNGIPSAYIENTPAVVGQALSFRLGSPTAPSGVALLKLSGGLGPTTHPVVGTFGLAVPHPFYASLLFFLDPNGDAAITIPLRPGIGTATTPAFYANCLTVEPGFAFSFSKTVRVEWADPDSWEGVPALASVRQMHTATALGGPRDDRSEVLICGGATGSLIVPAPMASAELFVPLTRTVRALPNMSLPRSEHRACRLPDGRVLITGGATTGGFVTATCEFFDPVTETFSAAPPMSTPRAGHALTLLRDGRVLVSGGVANWTNAATAFAAALNTAQATAEVFDPAANAWSALPPMASRRLGHSQTLLPDGRVLIVCGISGGGPSGNGTTEVPFYTASCEVFDPVGNTFTATAPMNGVSLPGFLQPTGYHAASLLPTGSVLVTGGLASGGLNPAAIPVAFCAVWDGANWTTAASLSAAVAYHRQVPLANGALLTGGFVGDLTSLQTTDAVGIHDGSNYTSLRPMTGTRAAHSCTRLHDGTFLVYGGGRWPSTRGDGAVYTPN